jgi:uncharacterized DUF497 family protein
LTTFRFGDFEWDEAKARANLRKHGVSFSEAATCFLDAEAFTAPDKDYPDRFILIGLSRQLRVLFMVSAELETASESSPPERRRPPSGKSTKMARKSETDLSRYDLARGTRGKYFEKARRSFETIVVDKKVAAALGGPEGVTALLEALAKSLGQAKKKRRAA